MLKILYLGNVLQRRLLYDVAVIQWIASCHKNRMTTCVITLWRVYLTSFTTFVLTMSFFYRNNFHFEGD